MAAKEVKFGADARARMLAGGRIGGCGEGNFGPKGRNVVLDKLLGLHASRKTVLRSLKR